MTTCTMMMTATVIVTVTMMMTPTLMMTLARTLMAMTVIIHRKDDEGNYDADPDGSTNDGDADNGNARCGCCS